jgi:voltage-gated potassium channel
MSFLLPQNWEPVIRRSVLVCVLTLVAGMFGFMRTEGWGPWESLYFTLVTLTTVGYGDYGVSNAGKTFAVAVMLVGIGTISYCLSQIVQYAAATATNPEIRMLKLVTKMSDHFIICGMGRTGERVARKLAGEGMDFVVIDESEDLVEQYRRDGMVALRGNATEDMTLMVAGIERARGLAAVTSCDASNAMICLTAKALKRDLHIAARAEQDSSVEKLTRAGANVVINPCRYGGDGIVESLVRPEVSCLLFSNPTMETGSLRFVEYRVSDSDARQHITIESLLSEHPGVVFIASKQPGKDMCVRPDVQHELKTNESLVFAGVSEDIAKFTRRHQNAA